MFTTQAPLRLTPPWREKEAAPPVYLAKVATLDERTLFEADLAGAPWNAPRVSDWELLSEIEEAIQTFTDGRPEDRASIMEALTRTRMREADAADRALLASVEAQATEHWPAYAALITARRRRSTVLPLLAVRQFLVGWENVAAPFERGADGRLSDATLAAISDDERRWLGATIYRHLFVDTAQGKPSGLPPSSPPAPATSKAGGARRTVGRGGTSKATPTKRTRA